jgi:hypothetical protein
MRRCSTCKQPKYRELAHCLDCLARAGVNRNWSKAEEDILFDMYGAVLPAAIQRALFKQTGTARARNAIIMHAGKLGIDHRTNQAEMTIPDAAKLLDVTRDVIYELIRRGFIKPGGRGKCHLLSDNDVEFLKDVFPPAPARCMTAPEAMARLGYGTTHMSRLLQAGAIRAVKRGHRWYVDADHVDELAAAMKKSGAVSVSWGDLPRLQMEREKFKQQVPKRRERRQEARRTAWYTKADARRVLAVGREEMTRLLELGIVRGRRENDLWLAERAHVDELAQLQLGFDDLVERKARLTVREVSNV